MTGANIGWLVGGLAVGAAAGIGGTYIYMKDKFEEKLNEEVNALKAHYVERDRKLAKKNEEKKKELEEVVYSSKDLNEFADYTKLYSENVAAKSEVIDEEEDVSEAAEIISDVEWNDPETDDIYRKISVDYFEDGAVFESLSGEAIDGFDMIAGEEWKGRFGEFTPGVVYVRNHDLKIDYEIIEQEGSHPHPEDE